jgi:HSP20 family protein
MSETPFGLMRAQVNAIYRAATGCELVTEQAGEETELAADDVALRFADLQAMARSIPFVSARVPPFSFTPQVDVLEAEKEWVVAMTVPGVDSDDVAVEVSGDALTVSGARRIGTAGGSSYLHAEIPRGPFSRIVRLPEPIESQPRVEFEHGMLSIRIAKAAR